MKKFHRGRVSREGGGFGRAGRGASGGDRPERGEFRRFGGRGPAGRPTSDFRRRGPDGKIRPELHDAVCAKCGQRCEVPFKPLPLKPVYCSNCYRKDDAQKRPTQLSEELDRINRKLDRILAALHLD